jgi:HlyD family secretion protein
MRKTLHFIIMLALTTIISCSGDKQHEKAATASGARIVENGELAAVDSRAFVMPRYGRYWYSMKITGILKHGTEVEKGDSIMQLDGTEIRKFIIERETQLATQNAVLEKMKVDMANRKLDLQSRLKSEQASFDLKTLEVESSRFDTDKNRRIKALEFEQSKLGLNKVKRTIQQFKQISEYTLEIEQIKLQQLRDEIKNAYDILPKLTLRSPISGIFQIADNRRTGLPVKIGDELYQGNNLGSVPDLTWMKVNTQVNETDYLRVKMGQKVKVRLDAMPKLVFMGEINYLGKLCHLKDDKSRQKIFDVEVKLLKSDSRLKPGMTVSCEYIE